MRRRCEGLGRAQCSGCLPGRAAQLRHRARCRSGCRWTQQGVRACRREWECRGAQYRGRSRERRRCKWCLRPDRSRRGNGCVCRCCWRRFCLCPWRKQRGGGGMEAGRLTLYQRWAYFGPQLEAPSGTGVKSDGLRPGASRNSRYTGVCATLMPAASSGSGCQIWACRRRVASAMRAGMSWVRNVRGSMT